MGTIIQESQYPGKCPECEVKFAKGDRIFYNKDPKIVCSSEECAKEQGWTQTANTKGFTSKGSGSQKLDQGFWNRKELDAVIPDVESYTSEAVIYLRYFKTADDVASQLYPGLRDVDKNTYGQIRSRICTDLIHIAED